MPKTKPKPKTGEIVLSALKKLTKNTGWTSRTIIKFIKLEYKLSDPRISSKISRALKRGVRMGLFQMDSGRFRLSDLAHVSHRISYRDIHVQRQRKRNCACIRKLTPDTCDYRLKTFIGKSRTLE
ncbi:unnamed protein product [Parnassius mnemosyne]|uniref:H15 domain-containing protein n=1 Tax=Parnassius mnemosyne TaxID=213953 RepID=A0AAV1MCB0_9NEOP